MALVACSSTVTANEPCPLPTKMNLEVGKYHLALEAKDPICITVPGEFKITIENPSYSGIEVGLNQVTIKQKGDSENPPVTISGSNDEAVNKILVEVTGTAEPGEIYEFWIKVDGVGLLDPRIRIITTPELNALQWAAVDETLDIWNLTFDDLGRLRPPPDVELRTD